MSTLDLQRKYAAKSSKQAIDRAIRAEIPNGAELLERHNRLYLQLKSVDSPTIVDELRSIRLQRMLAERTIRQRYGMPTK